MKKSIVKLLAVLLCAALLCGAFVSCNNEEKKTEDDTPSTSAGADEKGIWLPFVENK